MLQRLFLLALWLAGISLPAQTDPVAQDLQATAQRSGDEKTDPRITDVRLEVDDERVRLSFKLIDAFDERLRKRLDSGLPTGLTYELALVRSRKSWFDKSVDKSTLQVSAMYNVVTREYLINYKHDGTLIESRVVKDDDELLAAMTHFDDFPVFLVEGKNAQQRLRVRVRAELRTKTIFFFIPSTVHTDWAETRKFRLQEELE